VYESESTKFKDAVDLSIPLIPEDFFLEMVHGLWHRLPTNAEEIMNGRKATGSSSSGDLIELSELDWDADSLWPELLLYGSILVKNLEALFPLGTSTEVHNDRASQFIQTFLPNLHKARHRPFRNAIEHWLLTQQPDVCGSCFSSFGLTWSGRYRLYCPRCWGKGQNDAFERLMALQRVCCHTPTNVALLCQIIYKYYSFNGDPSYQIQPLLPRYDGDGRTTHTEGESE
jgi:hypothetical protein